MIKDLENIPVGENVGDRLILLRTEFIKKLGEDAKLRMKLQHTADDIYMVEGTKDVRYRS